MVCTESYSLNGCGKCILNFLNNSQLSAFSSLILARLEKSLLDLSEGSSYSLSLATSIVYCNGIVIPKAGIVNPSFKLTAFELNKLDYEALWLTWLSFHNELSTETRLLKEIILCVPLCEDIFELRELNNKLVLQLEELKIL